MFEGFDKIIYNGGDIAKTVVYKIIQNLFHLWDKTPLPIKIIIITLFLALTTIIGIKTYKSIKNKDYLKRNDYEGPLDELLR